MEIVVTGRHTEVPERFRRHLEEKLAKIPQLAPKVHRVDVELSHEKNPRQSDACERVEITLRAKGPVVRAEACADDIYAALDAVHASCSSDCAAPVTGARCTTVGTTRSRCTMPPHRWWAASTAPARRPRRRRTGSTRGRAPS